MYEDTRMYKQEDSIQTVNVNILAGQTISCCPGSRTMHKVCHEEILAMTIPDVVIGKFHKVENTLSRLSR